jgi:hypothetical protein
VCRSLWGLGDRATDAPQRRRHRGESDWRRALVVFCLDVVPWIAQRPRSAKARPSRPGRGARRDDALRAKADCPSR